MCLFIFFCAFSTTKGRDNIIGALDNRRRCLKGDFLIHLGQDPIEQGLQVIHVNLGVVGIAPDVNQFLAEFGDNGLLSCMKVVGVSVFGEFLF